MSKARSRARASRRGRRSRRRDGRAGTRRGPTVWSPGVHPAWSGAAPRHSSSARGEAAPAPRPPAPTSPVAAGLCRRSVVSTPLPSLPCPCDRLSQRLPARQLSIKLGYELCRRHHVDRIAHRDDTRRPSIDYFLRQRAVGSEFGAPGLASSDLGFALLSANADREVECPARAGRMCHARRSGRCYTDALPPWRIGASLRVARRLAAATHRGRTLLRVAASTSRSSDRVEGHVVTATRPANDEKDPDLLRLTLFRRRGCSRAALRPDEGLRRQRKAGISARIANQLPGYRCGVSDAGRDFDPSGREIGLYRRPELDTGGRAFEDRAVQRLAAIFASTLRRALRSPVPGPGRTRGNPQGTSGCPLGPAVTA